MSLEPGIYEGSEAPWWRFTTTHTDTTVVKQWMMEAAQHFANEISLTCAGGPVHVEVDYLAWDGSYGLYKVFFTNFRLPMELTVYRGEPAMEVPPHAQLPTE